MPRVTEAHRRARRDEIADAAVRVLQRRGVSSTSIAQIVEESGLSAGAIYANFANKSELAQYVAQSLLAWRIDLIDDGIAGGSIRTPLAVVRELLGGLGEQAPPLPVILQYWGEATKDPDIHAVLTSKISELRAAFERAIGPWAAERCDDAAATEALVRRVAPAMILLCQGYLANAALLGWMEPEEYLEAAGTIFAAD